MADMGIEADRRRLKSRRLRLIHFSCHCPAWVLSEAFKQLPDDAMIVKCHYDDINSFMSSIAVWSSQFEVVPESQMVPVIQIEARDTGEVRLMEQKYGRLRPCRFNRGENNE